MALQRRFMLGRLGNGRIYLAVVSVREEVSDGAGSGPRREFSFAIDV